MIKYILSLIAGVLTRVMPLLLRQEKEHEEWRRKIKGAMLWLGAAKNHSVLQIEGCISCPNCVEKSLITNAYPVALPTMMPLGAYQRGIPSAFLQIPTGVYDFPYLRGFSDLQVYDGTIRALVANRLLTLGPNSEIVEDEPFGSQTAGQFQIAWSLKNSWPPKVGDSFYYKFEWDLPRLRIQTFPNGRILTYRPYQFLNQQFDKRSLSEVIDPVLTIYESDFETVYSQFTIASTLSRPYDHDGNSELKIFAPYAVGIMGNDKILFIHGSADGLNKKHLGAEIYGITGNRLGALRNVFREPLGLAPKSTPMFEEQSGVLTTSSGNVSHEIPDRTEFEKPDGWWNSSQWIKHLIPGQQFATPSGLRGHIYATQENKCHVLAPIGDGMTRWVGWDYAASCLRIINIETGAITHSYTTEKLEKMMDITNQMVINRFTGVVSQRRGRWADMGIEIATDPLDENSVYLSIRDGNFMVKNRNVGNVTDRPFIPETGIKIVRCRIGG